MKRKFKKELRSAQMNINGDVKKGYGKRNGRKKNVISTSIFLEPVDDKRGGGED